MAKRRKAKTVLIIEDETEIRNFVKRALAMGASDYLVKPLSAASLKNAINRILG